MTQALEAETGLRVRSAAEPELGGLDAVAVPIFAGEPKTPAGVPERWQGLVGEVLRRGEHRGGLDEVWPLVSPDGARLLLFGLGERADLDGARLRNAHIFMVRRARRGGYLRLGVVPGAADAIEGVVEGCVLGSWERRSRVTTSPTPPLEELVVLGSPDPDLLQRATQAAEATNWARELQNTPANEMSPEDLARKAEEVARRRGLEFDLLGPGRLQELGYKLLLAVGSGSRRPPHLAVLRHRGGSGRSLALVGKGITFDAGGISIKPAENMHLMKGDMAGAAAVLAAMDVIGARRPPVDVIGVIAAADNMPDGSALRPGDVIKSAGPRSVEVVNTDAEGRLVLADAVTHALSIGATHIVDLATLTGVAKRAVGHAASAAIANDDELFREVEEAGREAGERVWRLPGYADYKVLLQSLIADIRNSDYGEAMTIMGALFIGEFVQGRPWVHLDIAASSWNDNVQLKTIPRGPSGAGTRTLIRLAELLAQPSR